MTGTRISMTFLALMFVVTLMAISGTAVQATTTTLDATQDTDITSWVNWANDARQNFASVNGALRVAQQQGGNQDWWVLIKWENLASIPLTDTIDDVTLQLFQSDGSVETTDVYRIVTGAWTDTTVTWNNYNAVPTLSLLGNMPNTSVGVTTFNDTDLTALVQDWRDGSADNHGLLFKWPGTLGEGDTYTSIEGQNVNEIPPQLVITHSPIPEPGTAVLLLGGLGTLLIGRRRCRGC